MATTNAMFTITDTGDLSGRNLIQRSFFTKDPWTGPTYNAVGDGFGVYHEKECLPVTTRDIYENTNKGANTIFSDLTFKEGLQYTISGNWAQFRTDDKYNLMYLIMHHTDGTIARITQPRENNTWSPFKLTSTAGKTVDKILISYGNNGITYIADLKLEVGKAATEWTPAPEDVNTAYLDAKTANETADYAKTEIDGLEVGGRNILKHSDQADVIQRYGGSVINTESNVVVDEWRTNSGIRYYGNAGTSKIFGLIGGGGYTYQNTIYYLDRPYTLSAYVKNLSETSKLRFAVNGTAVAEAVEVAPLEQKRVVYVYSKPNTAAAVQFSLYVDNAGDSFDFVMWHPQIEYGNRVTDWTPAPEDTDEAIADVNEKATGAVTAINDYIAGNEIIVGTQTASTSHWTGVAGFKELKDGQKITYWLPVASTSTAVDLNLTLADGKTTTGAIPVFYRSTTRATTHFPANCPVTLNYRENVKIGSTTYAKGWWADVSYYFNQIDRLQLSQPIKIKTGFTTDYPFIVSDDNGYFMLAPNKPFDVTKAILYYNSTADTTSGGTTTSGYLALSQCNLRRNKSDADLAVGASCYIEGILNGSTFTPSSRLFTDTPVNDQNGYYYLLLGYVTSKNSTGVYITLYPEHPIFKFVNGVFKSLNQVAYEANTLASEAKSAAESKNSVYYQTTAPTGAHKVGDTWFDTTKANDYKISRWNGSNWVAAKLGDQAIGNLNASHINAGTLTTVDIEAGKSQDIAGTIKVYDENDAVKVSLDKDGLKATKGIVGGWNIGEKTLESDHVSGVDESGVEHTGKSTLDVEGGLEIVGSSSASFVPDIYQRDWGPTSGVSLWGESYIGPRTISSEYLVANNKAISKGGFWIPGRNISAWYTLTPRKQIANTGMYFTLYTKGDLSLFWLVLDGKTPAWPAGTKLNNLATSLVDYVDSPTSHFIHSVTREQVAPPHLLWMVNSRANTSSAGRGGVCNNSGQQIQPYISPDGYINIWSIDTYTSVASIYADVFWAHIDHPYTKS